MNKNMNTTFVILVESTPITYSVRSAKFLIYSCNVSSGHCFLCRLPAACTSVAMSEYISSSFVLMSTQLLAAPIHFNILYGIPVDLAITSSYSSLLVSNSTFSICKTSMVRLCFYHHKWASN